jgi:hypothetical protein
VSEPDDSTRYLDKYLNELIDYGGVAATRAEVIRDMQAQGTDQSCIDRWLQGYECAQRIRARRERFEFKVILDSRRGRSRRSVR